MPIEKERMGFLRRFRGGRFSDALSCHGGVPLATEINGHFFAGVAAAHSVTCQMTGGALADRHQLLAARSALRVEGEVALPLRPQPLSDAGNRERSRS